MVVSNIYDRVGVNSKENLMKTTIANDVALDIFYRRRYFNQEMMNAFLRKLTT